MSGGINEEFEFEMRGGQCFPVSNTLTDELYCELGFHTAVLFAATLNMTGAFGNVSHLSEVDTALIEQDIQRLFPADIKISISAIDHYTANSFLLEMKATVIAEHLGYHGNDADELDTLVANLPALFSKFLDNNLLITSLVEDLDKLPNSENDPLRSAEKISIVDVSLMEIHFQDTHAGGAFAPIFETTDFEKVEIISSYTPPTNHQTALETLSNSVGVFSLVGILGVVIVIVAAVTRTRGSSEENLSSVNSTRPPADVNYDTNMEDVDSTHALFVTPRKMHANDLASSKQLAVHYEDDLDIYKKYMSTKTFL